MKIIFAGVGSKEDPWEPSNGVRIWETIWHVALMLKNRKIKTPRFICINSEGQPKNKPLILSILLKNGEGLITEDKPIAIKLLRKKRIWLFVPGETAKIEIATWGIHIAAIEYRKN